MSQLEKFRKSEKENCIDLIVNAERQFIHGNQERPNKVYLGHVEYRCLMKATMDYPLVFDRMASKGKDIVNGIEVVEVCKDSYFDISKSLN